MKKLFKLILLIALVAGAIWYFGRNTADPKRKIEWGVTFSKLFAGQMNIDWKQAYIGILDDLKIRNLRLVAYWPEIEKTPDKYDFSDLDWQINEADKRGAQVVLSLGMRLPRWPECHIPSWVGRQSSEQNASLNDQGRQQLLTYIENTVAHYKDNSAVAYWQVENEPFLNFGICPKVDQAFLDEEIALVKKLDSRPILISDSGELSIWYYAAKRGDIFGTTMYRWVENKYIGQYKYPIPPAFFRLKEKIIRLFVGSQKPFWVIELQGEPWQSAQIYDTSVNDQLKSLNLEEFKGIIDYAKQTGFSKYYLWGVEWWWSLKQNNHPEYWEYVKELTAPKESANLSVMVASEKTESKFIAVTIKNNSTESVFAHIGVEGVKNIERKTDQGGWEELFAMCQVPNCVYDIGPPQEIKTGESKSFEWQPLIFINGANKSVQAEPGQYRLVFLYEDAQKTDWQTTYSNEFTIY